MMPPATFELKDYFVYIQSVGIIGSLLIASFTMRRSLRTGRVSTYIDLVKSHRDIWSMPIKEEGLGNINSSTTDDWTRPISENEIMFVCFVINHISCSFELMKIDNLVNPEGLEVDIKTLFSRAIPRRVWEQTKHFRNKDFQDFIENSLKGSFPSIVGKPSSQTSIGAREIDEA